MIGRLDWTADAELDMIEIWLHIADDDVDAASRLAQSIQSKCELLADNPAMGRQRPDIGKHLRSTSVGNYVIFYQALQDGVLVIRILHGARDIGTLFPA